MQPPSDDKLIRDCLAGRQDAWDALVERYGRLVWSIARRYRLTDADGEEVFQSVFIIVFKRLESIRDASKLSSWIITTTHRECWRVGRANPTTSDQLDREIADVGAPSAERLAAWEEQHLVRRALGELGGRCETLLRALFYAPDRGYDSIAAELDMKVGSIGPTRSRCFAKLEQILLRLGIRPGETAEEASETPPK